MQTTWSGMEGTTVNVEIFALYIFLLNSRFLNIRENIYAVKITIIIALRVVFTKNANFNPPEIAHFQKSAKIYTRENIYVYSMLLGEASTFLSIRCSQNAAYQRDTLS